MSNFGFTDLRLVMPYDLAFQEARSAVKSKYILEQAQVFSTLAEAVADCSLVVGTTSLGPRGPRLPLYRLEMGARLIREHGPSSTALLFGSEKFGLSNEDMSHCHWLMRIPTREEHGSMNLGQAVSLCLYELSRDEDGATKEPASRDQASAEDLERITQLLLEILEKSGYVPERTSISAEQKTRRLIRRMQLPGHDAQIWAGMLRQILWKLHQSG